MSWARVIVRALGAGMVGGALGSTNVEALVISIGLYLLIGSLAVGD